MTGAEASLMAAALREIFERPLRWREGRSRSTAENARDPYHLHQSNRALYEWLGRAELALRNHLLRRGA